MQHFVIPHHVWGPHATFCDPTPCLQAPHNNSWSHTTLVGPTQHFMIPHHVWRPHATFRDPTPHLRTPRNISWSHTTCEGPTQHFVIPHHVWRPQATFRYPTPRLRTPRNIFWSHTMVFIKRHSTFALFSIYQNAEWELLSLTIISINKIWFYWSTIDISNF